MKKMIAAIMMITFLSGFSHAEESKEVAKYVVPHAFKGPLDPPVG